MFLNEGRTNGCLKLKRVRFSIDGRLLSNIYIYIEREIEIALSLPQLECPLTNISSRPLKAQDGPQPSEVYVNQASCALSSWISDAFRHSATVDARDLTAR